MFSDCSGDVFTIFVGEVGVPAVAELGRETGQTIELTVSQIERGCIVRSQQLIVPSGSSSIGRASGEIRVRMRTSNGTHSFSAEAIIKGIAEGTGFSGFVISGTIRPNRQMDRVRVNTRTNRYNVWEWNAEFRC